MPASREVFAWPEARFYLSPTGGAGAPGELSFVEDFKLTVNLEWKKDLSMASASWMNRTRFTLTDKKIEIACSKMWDGGAFFAQALSASAFSFHISAGGAADGNTASFAVYSAVFTNVGLQGSDGQIFKSNISMIAADLSAL